ncbi:MAG: amidase [Deltaproteobacteria bacterium]|nr:amidase [Deltaproteobacteria bacterium]
MNEILGKTLSELVAAVSGREVSAVEVMSAVLDRIEATNADLNAVVAMHDRERLLADARAADERVARGEARALEGVPLGVKDLEDTEGLITSHGSLPFKDNLATQDTVQVARLKAAGAIVVGKTNAPEFGATAITKNLVYGSTHNPWNLAHTPGGSSGGSAAALAAGVLPLVTSSDGGGSIRIPASFVGAFGLKTSYGRIPNAPSARWDYGDTAVSGPTTKTVADAALFLDQVAGPSALDPNSLPHPGISYQESLRAGLPSGLRIGYSADLGYAVVQSDIGEAVYDAVRAFEKLGHSVEDVTGGPPPMGSEWGAFGAFEMAARLRDLLPERREEFGRSLIRGVLEADSFTAEDFGRMQEGREALNRWCADVFDRYDLLVTPTIPYDPPPARGPFPTETEGRKQLAWGVASFTIPFNLSWHPAGTVRVGLSRAGLPMGMQIVAPRHRDDLVLQAAHAFERERPWHPEWPTAAWE